MLSRSRLVYNSAKKQDSIGNPVFSESTLDVDSLVEARQENKISSENQCELIIDENQLDILPIIMLEEKYSLFKAYLVGKKTLKNVYFGNEVLKMQDLF